LDSLVFGGCTINISCGRIRELGKYSASWLGDVVRQWALCETELSANLGRTLFEALSLGLKRTSCAGSFGCELQSPAFSSLSEPFKRSVKPVYCLSAFQLSSENQSTRDGIALYVWRV
jgi:hypothetical protein